MSMISLNGWEAILLAFAGAAFITWLFLPRIIKVAYRRQLTDKPGHRKVHFRDIPTLGGIGIFGGFSFGFLLSVNGFMTGVSYFTAALMILFFIGVKDDLISLKPYKKIIIQVVATLIISVFVNLRITNFHGFLGITAIPVWSSFLVTTFLFVIIVNAINLIDGIDGLAATIGIIASTAFGTWSVLSGDRGYAVMAAALAGALIVFLIFNLSKGKYKIFMGDAGSLVIGFIIVVMMIRFNEINAGNTAFHKLSSSPAVSMSILIVPLFDTLRVIIIRLARGESPLVADNRHIHHLLLRAGCTHARATLYIALANLSMITVAFLLDHIGILWLSLVLLAICIALTVPVYFAVARKENWNWSKASLQDIIFQVRKVEDTEVIRSKPVASLKVKVLEEEKYPA